MPSMTISIGGKCSFGVCFVARIGFVCFHNVRYVQILGGINIHIN